MAVYDKLGAQLATEHLIRYRSLQGPGVNVEVEVIVEGSEGSVTSSYLTPTLPTEASPPYHRSLNSTLWQSPLTMIVASLLGACLVMGAFLAIFKRRKATFQSRMAGFVSLSAPQDEQRRRALLTGRSSRAQRSRSSARSGGPASRRSSRSPRSVSRR